MPTSASVHHTVSGGTMTSQHQAVSVRTIINVCLFFVVICVSSAAKPSHYTVVKQGATNVQVVRSDGNYRLRLRTPRHSHEYGSRSPLTTPPLQLWSRSRSRLLHGDKWSRSRSRLLPQDKWGRSRSRLLPQDKWGRSRSRLLPRVKWSRSRSRLLPRVKVKRYTGQTYYTVEAVAVIDFDLLQDFKNIYGDEAVKKSKEYAAFVFKGVNDIYSSTDFDGFKLEIKLFKVFVITKAEDRITTKTEDTFDDALGKVREYVEKHILVGNYKKFDHVTLLVASEAKVDSVRGSRSPGFTKSGNVMCNASLSHIIIRANDTLTRTTAHYIAVNLDVGFDHFTRFRSVGVCDAGYLMSIKNKVPEKNRFKFSPCSKKYISDSVKQDWSACLKESNLVQSEDLPDVSARLFGTVFNTTQQCQILFGNTSKVSSETNGCGRVLCCVVPDEPICIYPYDGTPCNDQSHVCNKGECKKKVKQENVENEEKDENEEKEKNEEKDKNTGVCNAVVVDIVVAMVMMVVVAVYT